MLRLSGVEPTARIESNRSCRIQRCCKQQLRRAVPRQLGRACSANGPDRQPCGPRRAVSSRCSSRAAVPLGGNRSAGNRRAGPRRAGPHRARRGPAREHGQGSRRRRPRGPPAPGGAPPPNGGGGAGLPAPGRAATAPESAGPGPTERVPAAGGPGHASGLPQPCQSQCSGRPPGPGGLPAGAARRPGRAAAVAGSTWQPGSTWHSVTVNHLSLAVTANRDLSVTRDRPSGDCDLPPAAMYWRHRHGDCPARRPRPAGRGRAGGLGRPGHWHTVTRRPGPGFNLSSSH